MDCWVVDASKVHFGRPKIPSIRRTLFAGNLSYCRLMLTNYEHLGLPGRRTFGNLGIKKGINQFWSKLKSLWGNKSFRFPS